MRYIMYIRLALAAIRLLKKLADKHATKNEQDTALKEVIAITAKSGSGDVEKILAAFDEKDLATAIAVVKFIIGLKKDSE